MQLKNSNVIITGAARGIGKGLAEIFVEKGAHVHLLDVDIKALKKLKSELAANKNSAKISIYKADLTKAKQTTKTAKKILKQTPQIDILINNAGIGIYKNIENLDLGEWEKALKLNVTAPFLLIKELLPALQIVSNAKQPERLRPYVINIGSGCSMKGVAGRSSYCTTKFALRGLSLSLAKELEEEVNVLHLALGSVLTDFGPLTTAQKEQLSKERKNYLSVEGVAKKLIELVEKGYDKPEFELYPRGYMKQL